MTPRSGDFQVKTCSHSQLAFRTFGVSRCKRPRPVSACGKCGIWDSRRRLCLGNTPPCHCLLDPFRGSHTWLYRPP